MSDPRRRLRLLLAGDRRTVVDEEGRLPSFAVVLDDDRETTLAASCRALETISLTGSVLHCAVDQRPDADLDGTPRQALIVVPAPPAPWTPPARWTWSAAANVALDLPAPLAELAATRLAEIAADASPPELRAAWSRPGWHERATSWIDGALVAAGRRVATSVVQVRQWGISTVLRVETPEGRCWFKAAFPGFRQEAAVTEWLARRVPGAVPEVIAAERDEGWLLLADLGARTQSDDAETTRDAIRALIEIQRSTIGQTGALLDLGAPDRRLDRLVDDVAIALRSSIAGDLIGTVEPSELIEPLARAIRRIDGVLPDGLVHGDFHPGNTAHTGDGAIVFDWSDAAISCPVVDVPTWTWWYENDDDRVEQVWACFEAAWEREHGVDAGTVDRRAAQAIAGAYHTVSYVRILEGLEPIARHEHLDGVSHFVELLITACREEPDG